MHLIGRLDPASGRAARPEGVAVPAPHHVAGTIGRHPGRALSVGVYEEHPVRAVAAQERELAVGAADPAGVAAVDLGDRDAATPEIVAQDLALNRRFADEPPK